MPRVDQELLTHTEHLSSSPAFSRVRMARCLVLCVMFCRSLFVIFICFYSIYGFWLSLWSLQTFLCSMWLTKMWVSIFMSMTRFWNNLKQVQSNSKGGRRGRDRMVVGFTTSYAISAYHHWCRKLESRRGRGVQHYVLKFVSDLR